MTYPGGTEWCRWCGGKVRYEGGGADPAMQRAVHADTGRETGPDGHLIAPQGFEPPLWRDAREMAAEFGGRFTFIAKGGILRADPDPPTGRHFTGKTADELRAKLLGALAGEAAVP